MAENGEDAVTILNKLRQGPFRQIRLTIDIVHEDLVQTRIEIERSGNGNSASALEACLTRMCQNLEGINAAVMEAKKLSGITEEY